MFRGVNRRLFWIFSRNITFFSRGYPISQTRTCISVVSWSGRSWQIEGISTTGVILGMTRVARVRKAGSPMFFTSTFIFRVGCSPRMNFPLQHQSRLTYKKQLNHVIIWYLDYTHNIINTIFMVTTTFIQVLWSTTIMNLKEICVSATLKNKIKQKQHDYIQFQIILFCTCSKTYQMLQSFECNNLAA